MSFLSGLKAFGNDIEKVFAWTNSTQGKAVVSIVEGAVESFVPQTIPLVNLINSWGQKAFAVEALAVAAGQSSGNGAQKAAMVISSITPEVLQYATDSGLSPRTADQITAANTALVTLIKALTDPPTVTTPPTV
jgi:hypothetical protein